MGGVADVSAHGTSCPHTEALGIGTYLRCAGGPHQRRRKSSTAPSLPTAVPSIALHRRTTWDPASSVSMQNGSPVPSSPKATAECGSDPFFHPAFVSSTTRASGQSTHHSPSSRYRPSPLT